MEHFFKLAYKKYVKTRIFGENFVKRNINKCKIIYNNKEHQIKEFFEEIDKNYKPKEEKLTNDINDKNDEMNKLKE
jgi:hypothetical protein